MTIASTPGVPVTPARLAAGELRAPHTSYSVVSQYYTCQGKLQMPVVGAPGSSSSIVNVSAPWSKKLVTWYACRVGDLPIAPNPDTIISSEPGLVLIDLAIGVPQMYLWPDGVTREFSLFGWYLYAMPTPYTKTTQPYMPKTPNDAGSAQQFQLQALASDHILGS